MHAIVRFGRAVTTAAGLALGLALLLAGVALATEDVTAAVPGATSDQSNLKINELMASNRNTLVDPHEPGETPDWIEIYNPGPDDVSLDGLGLADGEPLDNGFAITNGLTITAGGFLLFYADNDPKQGPTHTNFGLSADGESVILYRVESKAIIDRIDYPALGTDVAYGRRLDGGDDLQELAIATPGTTNAFDPPRVSAVTPPVYPAPADLKFTVNAVVTDSVGLQSVTLHYTTAAGGAQSVAMNSVGINLYAADIPAQPQGTLVTYYVSALGSDEEAGRAPLAGREYRYLTGYVAPQLLINEIVVENDDLFVDPIEPNETPDWVELYNPGPNPVDLTGLSLSDDKDEPLRFVITTTLSIPAGGVMVFLADDDYGNNLQGGWQPPLHMGFQLNKGDAFVGLYGGEGTVLIDSHEVKDPPLTGAVGRVPDGQEWSPTVCPSFNAANFLCDQRAFMPVLRK